jgi:hypothetical protein
MKKTLIAMGALVAALSIPMAANAQSIERGAARGAAEGGAVAGPAGAVVGGTVGAAGGAVAGILGVDQRPRFHDYVVREHRPSYTVREDVRVGAVLPDEGVTYYEVPSEYGARDYRYTVVNGRTVLVEPRSRRVVEVIE